MAANLSITRPFTSNFGDLQSLTPHIMLSGNPVINDTLNWVQVSGCYTAQGGEEYLTIGNFFDNANTIVTGTTGIAYYYIEDVRVEEIPGVCVVGAREISYLNEVVGVSPNPTNDIVTITSRYDFEKIELLGITGQMLLAESVNSKTHQLQLQNFADGIYFVKVIYDNGMSVSKKVVVNH